MNTKKNTPFPVQIFIKISEILKFILVLKYRNKPNV
jgi:hypothetical protein